MKKLIGSKKIKHNKLKKHKNIMKKGKCSPCSANNRTLCCKQVIFSSTFKSQQSSKSYTIFHEINCSSAYVTYLMECTLYKKQYVGKSETSFNIRLNNHRKDVKKTWCHISMLKKHVFNKHPKFIIIDKLTNIPKSIDILRQRLVEREGFRIQTLETLHSKGLHQGPST